MISNAFLKNTLWLIAVGLISCNQPAAQYMESNNYSLELFKKISLNQKDLEKVGHLDFQENRIVGYDYKRKDIIAFYQDGDSILTKHFPVLSKSPDQRVVEFNLKNDTLTFHLFEVVQKGKEQLQQHAILQQNLEGSKTFFYKVLPQSIILQPGFYIYPPIFNQDYISLRGHIKGNWEEYFSNNMELKIYRNSDSLENSFPDFHNNGFEGYGAYVRDFMGRCVIDDSLYAYSVPIKNNLYVYDKDGVYLKQIPLGDVDEEEIFRKLGQDEDFSLMMKNIASKPYFSSFGIVEERYVYRVFEHQNDFDIKIKKRAERPWTLYLFDLKKNSNSSFEYYDKSFSPIISSTQEHLVFTENPSATDSVRTFWYFDVVRKQSK